MEETPQQQERIERYLRGELPEAERERLAAELAQDAELRRRVALHRDLEASFEDPEEARLRATLRSVDAERDPTAPLRRWLRANPTTKWTAAASLLLLIAAAIYWLVPGTPTSPRVLAATAFTPYPADVFRAESSGGPFPPDVLTAYQEGQYSRAAKRIAELPAYAESPVLSFYRAVALVGDGQGTTAVPLLRDLQAQQRLPALSEAIDWYLALAYLHAREKESAVPLLRTMAASPTHYQRAAAQRLLDRL